MRVADIMQKKVRVIAPDATVAELVQDLADLHVSGLPVVNPDGRVVGVVSATDVLQAGAEQNDPVARRRLFERTTVRDIMTSSPYMIEPDAEVREAAKQMLYADVHRLFVQEGGRLVGVVSRTDVAHAVGTGRL